MKLTVDTNLADPLYLYYVFCSREQQEYIRNHAIQTGVPHTNLSILRETPLSLPPVEEQRRIAEILGALDDKIELNLRINETIEAIARAVFDAWFTGEQSKSWPRRKWGELVALEYGKSLQGYTNSDGKVPVFGTNGYIGRTELPLCCHPGIIVGRKGAYRGIHFSDVAFHVIDTAFYVEPRTAIELRWAYYELLRFDLNAMDSGSAIPSTSRDEFYALPVHEPPIELQHQFVEVLLPFWERQRSNACESRTLAELRDTLLPKLLSGELRVRDAEKEVANAV